ncbi:MAG: hypothetical protein OXN92_00890 [Gammaproteobacteria bacterium]|nr:hypothetical protein [Gammaproteobacteria bacterium]
MSRLAPAALALLALACDSAPTVVEPHTIPPAPAADTARAQPEPEPEIRLEGIWHNAHTLNDGRDTIQLVAHLRPTLPWCPVMYKGQCTPLSARGFSYNVGGQVKWVRGGHDARTPHPNDVFWPDPFSWGPWSASRPNIVTFQVEPNVVLNIGVPEEVGVCEHGTYAEFKGSFNEDGTELTGTFSYECNYLLPGIPNTYLNPTGTITLRRWENP